MNDEEDWVMRPVLEGMCKYESLIDGTLSLVDVARMNEALEVKDENEARFRDAMEDTSRG
jgi:hypothetical protein